MEPEIPLPDFSSGHALPIRAHFSKVPPIPTPTTIGGQAFGPASRTASNIFSFTPSMPSAGFNMNTRLMFSLPNPFGATVMSTWSPSTIS